MVVAALNAGRGRERKAPAVTVFSLCGNCCWCCACSCRQRTPTARGYARVLWIALPCSRRPYPSVLAAAALSVCGFASVLVLVFYVHPHTPFAWAHSRLQLIPSFFRLRWLCFFPPSPSVLFPTGLVGLSFFLCSVLILVQLESLEKLVTDFDEIRIQHDHYRLKVEDLAQKVRGFI